MVNAAKELGYADAVRQNGTYCFVSGPCYETPTECRFLRSIGGDAVGMSSVPEVIAAKHCGMKVLLMSLVTNKVVLDPSAVGVVHAHHAEVLEAAANAAQMVEGIVTRIISKDVLGPFLAALPAASYKRKGLPAAKGVITKVGGDACGITATANGSCCPPAAASASSCCAPNTSCGNTANSCSSSCTWTHMHCFMVGAAAIAAVAFIIQKSSK